MRVAFQRGVAALAVGPAAGPSHCMRVQALAGRDRGGFILTLFAHAGHPDLGL
jgi:hypothetical protein